MTVFSDDFSSGDFSLWDSSSGAATVVDEITVGDSTVDLPAGTGVSVAFMAAWDDPSPAVWTRIDDPSGINVVGEWSIDRGRGSEMDKTKTGTASIQIVDTQGVLDPTNSSSPVFALGAGASIDPMRQIAINLKHPVTGAWHTQFRGFIDVVELELDEAENCLRGSIECVDAQAVLATVEVIPDDGTGGHVPPLVTGSGGTGAQVLVPTDSAGDVFYEDGGVDDRIRAALADANWDSTMSVVFSGNVNVQETVYAVRSTILQILQDAADAEFPGVANVYVDRFGRVVFHGRLARFDPFGVAAGAGMTAWPLCGGRSTPWATGDFSAWGVDTDVVPIRRLGFNRSAQFLINAALATPQNIIDADIQGQFNFDAGSITTYSVRSASWENLLTKGGKTDGNNAEQETFLFSTYYKDNFKDPKNRISRIEFHNVQPGHPNETALWDMVCQADIADLMDIVTSHPGGGGFNETFHVEGVRMTASPLGIDDYHDIVVEYDLTPDSYYGGGISPF